MKKLIALGLVLSTSVAAFMACRSVTCDETKTCDDGTTPGTDGGTEGSVVQQDGQVVGDGAIHDAGSDSPAVDPNCTKSPSEDPTVLSDKCGIFVATTGKDTDVGSQAAPVFGVTAAVQKAQSSGKAWVFVCSGTYTEPTVNVTGTLGVYGKLDCSNLSAWKMGTTKAVINAKNAGEYVFSFANATGRLEGVEVHALDATAAGGSSIAVFVNGGSLTVSDSKIVAGNGKDGAPGASGGARLSQQPAGGSANGTLGGQTPSCLCPDGTSVGGNGGSANNEQDGGVGKPDLGGTPDGAGGATGGDCSKGSGHGGAAGDAGVDGKSASLLGLLTEAGWAAGIGSIGTAGGRGQGGGGGAANSDGMGGGGGGGGGGCGGCGGQPGSLGAGGGTSASLMSLNSVLAVSGSVLIAGSGGAGGTGGTGQLGQRGGPGGAQASIGCPGGGGGTGGTGGMAGGGAGGSSFGILYKGSVVPTLTNSTVTHGAAGKGGAGGVDTGVDGGAGNTQVVN